MPNTFSAVLVIVVFVIPGFIANRILSAAHSRSASSDGNTVLEAIALSSLNYAFLSWLLALAWIHHWYENPFLLVAIAFCTLFVCPVVIALVFARFVDARWGAKFRLAFGMAHPVLKAWDTFFRTGKRCWVVATLKGGRVIAGYFGPNSYASSFPAEEDLYLEKLCKLSATGAIEGLAEFSAGGIIQMKNVETLELFEEL
jgi:hypothetical protein